MATYHHVVTCVPACFNFNEGGKSGTAFGVAYRYKRLSAYCNVQKVSHTPAFRHAPFLLRRLSAFGVSCRKAVGGQRASFILVPLNPV